MEKGFILAHYEIEAPLDPQNTLFLGRDRNLGRSVLIWQTPYSLEQVRRTVQQLTAIQQPAIPTVLYVGEHEQHVYVVYDVQTALYPTAVNLTAEQSQSCIAILADALQATGDMGVHFSETSLLLTDAFQPILATFRLEDAPSAVQTLSAMATLLLTGVTTLDHNNARLPIPVEAFLYRASQGRYDNIADWLAAFKAAMAHVTLQEDTNPALRSVPPPQPLAAAQLSAPSVTDNRIPCAAVLLLSLMILVVVSVIGFSAIILVQHLDRVSQQPNATATGYQTATPFIVANIDAVASSSTTLTTKSVPTVTVQIVPQHANAAAPTVTFTLAPPTQLPASPTATPTRTQTASITPSHTQTPSQTFTPSLTRTPSQTPSLTRTSTPTFTPSITPTSPFTPIAFPNGRRVVLYYDDYTFYIYNPTAGTIPVTNINIEGLTASGDATGQRFNGSTWAQFYSTLESGKCVAIETTLAPALLRPTECQDYNAIITPQRTSQSVFWINDGQTAAFQVFWGETEVGQCSLRSGICDIYFP